MHIYLAKYTLIVHVKSHCDDSIILYYETFWVDWWVFGLPLAPLGGEREHTVCGATCRQLSRESSVSRCNQLLYGTTHPRTRNRLDVNTRSKGIVTFIMDPPTKRNPTSEEQQKRKMETDDLFLFANPDFQE